MPEASSWRIVIGSFFQHIMWLNKYPTAKVSEEVFRTWVPQSTALQMDRQTNERTDRQTDRHNCDDNSRSQSAWQYDWLIKLTWNYLVHRQCRETHRHASQSCLHKLRRQHFCWCRETGISHSQIHRWRCHAASDDVFCHTHFSIHLHILQLLLSWMDDHITPISTW